MRTHQLVPARYILISHTSHIAQTKPPPHHETQLIDQRALSGAGSANASCASLNGHNIGGHGCTSTVGSASIGLGRDAQADSAGPGSVAVAVGNPGYNRFYNTSHPTLAYAHGTGNTSVALGDGTLAGTLGTGNRAFVLGQGSNAFSYGGNVGNVPQPGRFNTSVTVGDRSEAGAVG